MTNRMVASLGVGLVLAGASCSNLTERLSPLGGGAIEPPASFRQSEDKRSPQKRDDWWKLYRDPEINRLITLLHKNNPDLSAALARVDQSFAVLGGTRKNLWPTMTGTGSVKTRRDAVNELLFPIDTSEYERYRLGVSASWEIDLWGRVRGLVKRDRANAQAESGRYLDARLSLEATLVREIFAWRAATAELAVLNDAIQVRADDLALQEARLELGSGVEVDVSRSRVELSNARAAAEAAQRSRGKLEHAIAVLLGVAPSEAGALVKRELTPPPKVAAGVPASLLVQRPDVRAASQQLNSAALEIGIRKVDYLPKFSLTGTGGIGSLKTSNLFKPDSSFFDIGPEFTVPLFGAGARKSAVAEAEAAWKEALANYRSTFLTAVREVDDALLETQSLTREHAIQEEAVAAAKDTSEIARLRHDRGLSSYFEVVDAERERLTAMRTEISLREERHAATVRFIQSLGGRW